MFIVLKAINNTGEISSYRRKRHSHVEISTSSISWYMKGDAMLSMPALKYTATLAMFQQTS